MHSSKKKRRMKIVGKTPEHREDEIPWSIPMPFDPTFLPTSLYKTAFASTLLTSSNVQTLCEPYHSLATKSSSFQPTANSTRMEPIGDSGCASTPVHQPCIGSSREASNSCPNIAVDVVRCSGSSEIPLSIGKPLPPIGVFWDIENCSVPKGRSALVAVQRIRERFFIGHLEAEFLCVCDIRKEAPTVIQELNDAQVSVVHVSGNSKNAADDKLRQAMRRFADISCSNPLNSSWRHPATIVLISGDINFATDLSDLRYRKRLYVILLHNRHAPDALLLCAHEQYEFHSILTDLPFRSGYRDFTENDNLSIPLKGGLNRVDALATDLPLCNNYKTLNLVRNRLRKLSENCGGKVLSIRGQWALIRFPNYEAALRASKRMNGEDVLGNKIRVVCCPPMEFQSAPNYQPQNVHEEFSTENFMMPSSQHQGNFLASTWNPTWKRAADSSHHTSRHGREANKYNASTTAQSNSSSTNETSRDGSPSVSKSHNIPTVPVQPQLANFAQYVPAQGNNITSTDAATNPSSFAFHQYPVECGPNSFRQDCQTPPQVGADMLGTPRLYSTTIGAGDTNTHNQSFTNQHIMPMYSDGYGKPSPVGNGIYISQSVLAPLSVNNASENQSMVSGQGGNYSKYRNSDADSFDLNVTNIDPALGDWKTIRSTLMSAFSEHVNVRGVWVYVANDGTTSAIVRLVNKEEAHYAVAQLHRKKIGNKRIFISFDNGNAVDHETLKKEVASLLQDVPSHTLPLFKFREMFEKRYKRSVSSSDLYRMKDVVHIAESTLNGSGISTPTSGRIISLTSGWQHKDGKGLDLYCKLHPPRKGKTEKPRMGWAEKEAEVLLPNVIIEIKTLSARVHSLLQSHEEGLPLISFLDCYESEFGVFERATGGRGVPLEHLISCVQGAEIVFGDNGMKRVKYLDKKDEQGKNGKAKIFKNCTRFLILQNVILMIYDCTHSILGINGMINQPLMTQLSQFGRELIDLLKTFPKCTLPFAKLIPCYHAHFGRQCRVADYGHFSLTALLQTLPHIVQIMGAAQNRFLTLSHKAQMKRFATDTLRVLKSQGGPKKQIGIEDFPTAFTNVFPQRQFQPEDYGICFFSDLVAELVERSTLVALIKDEDGNAMLAVPKREQTPQEIHKTRIFASEVVELLRHSTRCELEFSKFVPYYHHHFQKQCRVSDYGFGKLAELFDAINDTVMVINSTSEDCAPDDKTIRLTPKEQIKVVGEQICNIIEQRKSNGQKIRIEELVDRFLEVHGFLLRPDLCGAENLEDLVYNKLESFLMVEDGELIAKDRVQIEDLAQKAETILQQAADYTMDMDEFISKMIEKWDVVVNETTIEKDFSHIMLVTPMNELDETRTVSLTPLRIFAHDMSQLLESHGGYLPLSNIENAHLHKYGQPLRPAQLGYPSLLSMLQAIPDVLSLKGRHRTKKTVMLNSAKFNLESGSDESSGNIGKLTPVSGDYWKNRESRPHSTGASSLKHGKRSEWNGTPKRRSAPPPPLFSPLASPVFHQQASEGSLFAYDQPTPLSPPVCLTISTTYGCQKRFLLAPPPMSPPVVWTCHPIFYPSSPPPGGHGNILVPSTYVAPAWSPPPPNCFENMPQTQQTTMLGNEFLFGRQNRLTASFERLTVDTSNEA
ncbi:Meiosis arrest female protein 1 [Orchesella cincta]|uniref:Meiosis arrest female protein 1 n=1 Tax=Orchesella cincta TaxID=48709 RepID=A0A1D2MU99_ORCCI|nr:Meiosis arrest female protein 1 [Orchesella cincta]